MEVTVQTVYALSKRKLYEDSKSTCCSLTSKVRGDAPGLTLFEKPPFPEVHCEHNPASRNG